MIGQDVESYSPQEQIPADDRLEFAKRRLDEDYLIVGRELFLAFASGRFKKEGFNTFNEWAIHKGIDPGRANRLRRVFKVFQRDLNVHTHRLQSIGYERAVAILPVIRLENAAVWLARAETLPYAKLVELVSQEKPKRKKRSVVVQPPGTDPQSYKPEDPKALAVSLLDEKQQPSGDGKSANTPDETVYEKTFYLVGDQAKVVETALEEVERQTGSSKTGYLLSCALIEFLANRATREVGDDGRLKYWLGLLEQRYGGKLLWVRDDEVGEKLSKLVQQAEDDLDVADEPAD